MQMNTLEPNIWEVRTSHWLHCWQQLSNNILLRLVKMSKCKWKQPVEILSARPNCAPSNYFHSLMTAMQAVPIWRSVALGSAQRVLRVTMAAIVWPAAFRAHVRRASLGGHRSSTSRSCASSRFLYKQVLYSVCTRLAINGDNSRKLKKWFSFKVCMDYCTSILWVLDRPIRQCRINTLRFDLLPSRVCT